MKNWELGSRLSKAVRISRDANRSVIFITLKMEYYILYYGA